MKTLYVANLRAFIQTNGDNLLQVKEIEEDVNQLFEAEYIFGNWEKAKRYLDDINIDIDYQDGFFLSKAVQRGDVKMIKELLDRGATAGLKDALKVAELYEYKECEELLNKHMTNLPDPVNKTV